MIKSKGLWVSGVSRRQNISFELELEKCPEYQTKMIKVSGVSSSTKRQFEMLLV